jgi:hypothetical protein
MLLATATVATLTAVIATALFLTLTNKEMIERVL